MRQLQSVQRATPGATTSEARELTTKYTLPASPDKPPAEFRKGQATAMETDTPTSTLVERHQLDRLRADLVLSGKTTTRAVRQEKEAADTQIRELATQLELAQLQLEKVRTKADLEAAFADLDTVQAQLDEEHERNNKLQERVRAREGDMSHEAPGAPPAILVRGTSRIGVLRRSVGEFPALTPGFKGLEIRTTVQRYRLRPTTNLASSTP
ncbi:hypothetical protein R1flu_006862 [Riccia fluitans]|uniref:Uncharacterized protein n=1 Tax=Riccia fluitans TaxID=41844 RepID=A0ABD1YXF2_9MARC